MKKYIKPAIEVIDMDVESELMGSSHKNEPEPNIIDSQDNIFVGGFSTESSDEDSDKDGLIEDM